MLECGFLELKSTLTLIYFGLCCLFFIENTSLAAQRELGQDEIHVADVRRSPLVPHQLQHLPPGPSPGCSYFITATEQMLNILD